MEPVTVESLQIELRNAMETIQEQAKIIRAYNIALKDSSRGRNLGFILQGGSRIQPQRLIFKTSRCKNCESKFHTTRNCESLPILRNTDWTPSSATANNSYLYSYLRFVENITAGEVINFWHYILNWEKTFSRNEVQCLFSVYFFNRVCWYCYGNHPDRHCAVLLAGLLAGEPYPDLDNCIQLRESLSQFILRNPTLRSLNDN